MSERAQQALQRARMSELWGAVISVSGQAREVQVALERAGSTAEVLPHPYDVGYWSRVAGLGRPEPVGFLREHITGWTDADRELRGEE